MKVTGQQLNDRLMQGVGSNDPNAEVSESRRSSTSSTSSLLGRANQGFPFKRVLLGIFTLGFSECVRAYKARHSQNSGPRVGGIGTPPIMVQDGNKPKQDKDGGLFGPVASHAEVYDGMSSSAGSGASSRSHRGSVSSNSSFGSFGKEMVDWKIKQ